MRRVEAGKGEDDASRVPVGVRRMRVWIWGVWFAFRRAVRGFVRSILEVGGGIGVSRAMRGVALYPVYPVNRLLASLGWLRNTRALITLFLSISGGSK